MLPQNRFSRGAIQSSRLNQQTTDRTARKRSLGRLVFWDLHRNAGPSEHHPVHKDLRRPAKTGPHDSVQVLAWFRYLWTICMAMEPSPTAEATRLTDPHLTSPAANTPGTLVSRSIGERSRGHPLGGSPSGRRSLSVKM